MNASFVAQSDEYPSIYKIRFDKPSELSSLFQFVILKDTPCCKVHEELVKYVTTIIEPVGWTAIWRTSRESFDSILSFDFVVEVLDVSRSALEATVVIRKLLSPSLHDIPEEEVNASVKLIEEQCVRTVPLIELYVISEGDENEQFLQTAVVIEHIRFFWKCIWRPWDDFNDNRNEPFIEDRFTVRFNLYCDIQEKAVVQSSVNRINRLLEEAWKIRKRLDEINIQVAKDDTSSKESNELLDENLMYETFRLKFKLEEIERVVKLFEDPFSRVIASSLLSSSVKAIQNERDKNGIIHMLAKSYDCSTLNEVISCAKKLGKIENKMFFHHSLSDALSEAANGDVIWIMPGVYENDLSLWIDVDVTIHGISRSSDDVILTASEDIGDVFLHCCSSNIELSNLTLRTSADTQCMVMVHNGLTKLNTCILDGTSCTKNVLITLSRAKVAIDNCEINSKEATNGINIRPGGDVTINGDHPDIVCDDCNQLDI
ncbi:SHC SH2 domain-binding protein-like protein [Dinothrombium tinctorium]|uniref:SHC SH2 domain-binding protein-like protein n=1 Tax=Dinothrombium tinctorium TaxID=1965070 RepID=A0A443QMY3_9ACAR|nr:SHC SH2 domain-binding protein-like protein [Dinothrombium tinctorium]